MLTGKRLKPRKVISTVAGTPPTSRGPSREDQAPQAGKLLLFYSLLLPKAEGIRDSVVKNIFSYEESVSFGYQLQINAPLRLRWLRWLLYGKGELP